MKEAHCAKKGTYYCPPRICSLSLCTFYRGHTHTHSHTHTVVLLLLSGNIKKKQQIQARYRIQHEIFALYLIQLTRVLREKNKEFVSPNGNLSLLEGGTICNGDTVAFRCTYTYVYTLKF